MTPDQMQDAILGEYLVVAMVLVALVCFVRSRAAVVLSRVLRRSRAWWRRRRMLQARKGYSRVTALYLLHRAKVTRVEGRS